ncbi:hypothetical protein AFM11_04555 [Mycolicibacterium wolinskyi]|uniref:Phosphohistidine phosphatase n=1 Tax=Mycolicibacterium wolinskyi TaxID=59750 RepID=A0A132PT47_9MYCO|nr:GNAT family N-acyltransferase [Mycolicibacterium wolinskyi]KWX25516.1 hypothetical protein AFM11_04555 [Mycolicibacterium wolinskyi]
MTNLTTLLPTKTTTPRYSVQLTTDPDRIDGAQRLRYAVLAEEGGRTASAFGLDADRFDEHCVHVLIEDNRSGELVACCRMLPSGGAIAAGDLCIAASFDIAALEPLRLSMLEFGRAVVRADHRNGAVVLMMWSAVLEYAYRYGYDHVLGCVTMPAFETSGRGRNVMHHVWSHLRRNYRAPDCYTVRPHRPVVIDALCLSYLAPHRQPELPALMRGYLRAGARICGEPAYDPVFGFACFPTLLSTTGDTYRPATESALYT